MRMCLVKGVIKKGENAYARKIRKKAAVDIWDLFVRIYRLFGRVVYLACMGGLQMRRYACLYPRKDAGIF